jgi:integrase
MAPSYQVLEPPENPRRFIMMKEMRLGEALKLRWLDVDFDRNVITIRNSKNGERREVPMTDYLHKTLAGKSKDSDHVFCTPAGKPYTSGRSLWETFKRATKKVGIVDLRLHDLRHHFASSLRMKGVDLLDIKEYLGHKSITMTMRYAHITTERKKAVIKCLDGDFVETSAVISDPLHQVKTG